MDHRQYNKFPIHRRYPGACSWVLHEFVLIDRDYAEALNEAIRLDYSAYDMLYLILARNNGAVLLTCDGPLNRIAQTER
jgi:predicted nucleic acid-binding protein